MKQLKTREDVTAALAVSDSNRVFFFKHSTACPISSQAHAVVSLFSSQNPEVPVFFVHVIEDRAASNFIAEHSGVRHESPQVLVFEHGKVVYDASHFAIDLETLTRWLV